MIMQPTNLASLRTIEFLCNKYGFRPQRSAGQNFLISESTLHSITAAADLDKTDTVLEIGAGFGTLTSELVLAAGKVMAVELDKRLVLALIKLAAVNKNLEIILGDIFGVWQDIQKQLPDNGYKLVANLPYNITSLVLRNFLANTPRPKTMVVLVQKEVAERIVAPPGKMSILSIAVQFYGQPEIIKFVSKQDFWPEPEIDSAILRINDIGSDKKSYRKKLGKQSDQDFFRIVKIGFSAKRKQLHNNLSAGLRLDNDQINNILAAARVAPSSRAQDLSIDDWIKLTRNIAAIKTTAA